MLVIVGLGNPGGKYQDTRHNIGFRITGALSEKFGINGKLSSKFRSIIGKGSINGAEVMIVQPQTFMNLSGEAISAVLNWHKLDISNLFVVFDDVSIDFGKIRFRPDGTAGGHNGIKSIISNCGSQEFARLKVGVGLKQVSDDGEKFNPNLNEVFLKNYVLQKFSKEEQKYLSKITNLCVEAIEFYTAEGMEAARNKFNGINVLEDLDK